MGQRIDHPAVTHGGLPGKSCRVRRSTALSFRRDRVHGHRTRARRAVRGLRRSERPCRHTGPGLRRHSADRSFVLLTDLAVQRILLSDEVAAAKFGTGRPIDDPAREQQVLDQVTTLSTGMGLDPATGTRFFRDQIDAGKIVQHGLYALWTTHPKLRPADRPDLTTEVRPQLDKITAEVLEQLKATAGIRGANRACDIRLSGAAISAVRHRSLDRLHRDALNVALRSVCTAPSQPTNGTG